MKRISWTLSDRMFFTESYFFVDLFLPQFLLVFRKYLYHSVLIHFDTVYIETN